MQDQNLAMHAQAAARVSRCPHRHLTPPPSHKSPLAGLPAPHTPESFAFPRSRHGADGPQRRSAAQEQRQYFFCDKFDIDTNSSSGRWHGAVDQPGGAGRTTRDARGPEASRGTRICEPHSGGWFPGALDCQTSKVTAFLALLFGTLEALLPSQATNSDPVWW